MAQANVGIQLPGRRVDLNGEIPDEIAYAIVQQITALLIATPPATPAPDVPAVESTPEPPNA
ncbi:hypothetical protein [Arthrobacter sp. GMC3]|uniref:hypothetical protein n=1 Tax=Arthrobacter sp. GMC3 TaxID=2058894 RepID=UPI000CE41786|nr:hypothetical protein [Arthrobacter sp. GMC3]